MKRVLYTIPIGEDGFPLFGYGVMLMLGFVVALALAWYRGKKTGMSGDSVLDVGLIAIFAGVVGSRIAYLLIDYHPSDGRYGSWKEWIAVWQGGLTFQGGLFLALAACWLYLKWKKISVGKMFDIFAPALAVGVGFGRLGCLLNGCCWGKPAPHGSLLAMQFPGYVEPMAMQHFLFRSNPDGWNRLAESLGYPAGTFPTIPIYATQIVSAIGLFLIAAGLVWAERRWRDRAEGQVVVWFLLVYSIGRFVIELYRDDTPLRYGFGAFPGLRLGQWLAVAMFALGIAAQIWINRGRKKNNGETNHVSG